MGVSPSQAQAMVTESLEAAIQTAAQTQLDQESGGEPAESLATTVPWQAWSQPLASGENLLNVGDSQTAAGREYAPPSESESDLSSQGSHRRRRFLAVAL